MPYRLHLIHADQKEIADLIAARMRSELGELGYDQGLLQVESGYSPPLPPATLACGLYIGSVQGKGDAACDRQIGAMKSDSIPVVPLVRDGDNFAAVTPDSLHPINAMHWKGPESAATVVAHALRLLGLTEKQRRVFISYRRSDALKMGEQVWQVLSKNGFEVFIDRFYVDPGVRFQERLTEALSDKAFVLLIESPDVPSSNWVEYEVIYAHKHRLGFLSLTWPQTVAKGRMVGCVEDSMRVFLSDKDVRVTAGQGELQESFLDGLPSVVEAAHAKAMLLRRRQLMSSLQRELSRFGIGYKLISDWSVLAETNGLGKSGDHVISLTPRPPEIPDLFVLDSHCRGRSAPVAQGVLIHTVAPLPEERVRLFTWVLENRAMTLVDEDQIVQLVEGIASGKGVP